MEASGDDRRVISGIAHGLKSDRQLAVKARRCASGARGRKIKRSAARPADAPPNPRPDRRLLPSHRLPSDRRPNRRLDGRSGVDATDAAILDLARRQGVRQRGHPPPGRGQRRHAEHSAIGEPAIEKLLSRRSFTATATPSSPCSAGSRTFAASPRATIALLSETFHNEGFRWREFA